MEFQTTLFPYQKEAFEKLKNLKVCALYMEQGTGKTRTALEIVNDKLIKNKINVVLWLCPCSVKKNLKLDLIKHCGFLPKNFIIKGKQYQRNYKSSDIGKEKQKLSVEKYAQTEKGREARRRAMKAFREREKEIKKSN